MKGKPRQSWPSVQDAKAGLWRTGEPSDTGEAAALSAYAASSKMGENKRDDVD
jgi:hypothetical protein